MPRPLEIARALASVLEAKVADPSAERIEISREEAALCLGVINGVAENLSAGSRNGP